MHSLSKIRRFYPELSNTPGPMRFLYRRAWNSEKNENGEHPVLSQVLSTSGAKYKESDLFESVKNISYDEFLDKTSLDFEIIGNYCGHH